METCRFEEKKKTKQTNKCAVSVYRCSISDAKRGRAQYLYVHKLSDSKMSETY